MRAKLSVSWKRFCRLFEGEPLRKPKVERAPPDAPPAMPVAVKANCPIGCPGVKDRDGSIGTYGPPRPVSRDVRLKPKRKSLIAFPENTCVSLSTTKWLVPLST